MGVCSGGACAAGEIVFGFILKAHKESQIEAAGIRTPLLAAFLFLSLEKFGLREPFLRLYGWNHGSGVPH
jgi:hypothetical protein